MKQSLNIEELGLQRLDSTEMNQITGGGTAYDIGYFVGFTIGYTYRAIVEGIKLVF